MRIIISVYIAKNIFVKNAQKVIKKIILIIFLLIYMKLDISVKNIIKIIQLFVVNAKKVYV